MASLAYYSISLSGIDRHRCILTRFSGKERHFSIQRALERNTQLRTITYSVTPFLLLANNNSPTRASIYVIITSRDITAVSYNFPLRKWFYSFPLP